MTGGYARHTLSPADLAGLGAGRFSPVLVDTLKRAVASRNIALLESVRRSSGPVAVDDLWRRLGSHPGQALDVLISPQLGAWADDALRHGAGDAGVLLAALEREKGPAALDGPRPLRLRFETGEPLRGHFGLAVAEPADWAGLCREAYRLLLARHPRVAGAFAELVTTVVPVVAPAPPETFSATSGVAFGAVALSAPGGAAELAATFAHELQHQVLGAAEEIVALTVPGHPGRFAVHWRAGERDAAATLQGIFAHVAVMEFHRAEWLAGPLKERPGHAAAFALWRLATGRAMEQLGRSGALTAAGALLARPLSARISAALAEPVPAPAARAAEAEFSSSSAPRRG
ncbi:aKG-HExxH-type peptide beta-hydroxylase [Nonomuraea sp. NPDC050790]|uniref:aKG-HExxH-type peptide beta-hydroxylase n=1 Tax=Nonomuraea sp. NPDC050790 TaxID=3364371 RepID=UPI00378DFCFA